MKKIKTLIEGIPVEDLDLAGQVVFHPDFAGLNASQGFCAKSLAACVEYIRAKNLDVATITPQEIIATFKNSS